MEYLIPGEIITEDGEVVAYTCLSSICRFDVARGEQEIITVVTIIKIKMFLIKESIIKL